MDYTTKGICLSTLYQFHSVLLFTFCRFFRCSFSFFMHAPLVLCIPKNPRISAVFPFFTDRCLFTEQNPYRFATHTFLKMYHVNVCLSYPSNCPVRPCSAFFLFPHKKRRRTAPLFHFRFSFSQERILWTYHPEGSARSPDIRRSAGSARSPFHAGT